MMDNDNAPFLHRGRVYKGKFEEVTIKIAVREKRLEELVRINNGWMKPLKKLSNKRWKAFKKTFKEEDILKDQLKANKNQPSQPDQSEELV